MKITKSMLEQSSKIFKTAKELAKYHEVNIMTIYRALKKWNIEFEIKITGRPQTASIIKINCFQCGKEQERKNYIERKFCNMRCYQDSKKGIPLKNIDYSKIDRSYTQTPEFRLRYTKPDTPEYTRYKNRVHKLSNKTYMENINIINPGNYKRTLCGVVNGWQLDHIKEVRKCFDEKWTPEMASDISNLQLIPWRQNLAKNKKVGL